MLGRSDQWPQGSDARILRLQSCYEFDLGDGNQPGFLKADVNIECGTASHMEAKRLAYIAIGIYPAFLLSSNAAMLLSERQSIVNNRPTPFSMALSFLHAEFRPSAFVWERVCEGNPNPNSDRR